MNQTNTITNPTTGKVGSTDIMPGAVLPSHITSRFIQSTTVSFNGPVTLNNGSALNLTSVISSTTNPNIPLFGNFAIVFFQGSLTPADAIGYSLAADYGMIDPVLLPPYSPNYSATQTNGGTNGNELIYYTQLLNNTGSNQTIYYITNTKVIQTGGHAA